ncbi:MAG TPA: hypothetical protein VM389_14020, partial [Phycisphaerae bacterium]|nr:hypothetical protein [Phycisphaerae bacterium]
RVAESLQYGPGQGAPHWLFGLAEKGEATEIPAERSDLPLARDVRAVHLVSTAALEPGEEDEASGLGRPVPLLADSQGLRILTRRVGSGRVIVLADSSFLANRWIGLADNAVLAANLLAYAVSRARGGRVAYDEYHQGRGRSDSSWRAMAAMLFETPPGWGVLAATAAGVLLLIYKGRRFGRRRAPPARARRRSKTEYVHSVGATYRAAGAHRLTLRLIFRWFRGRCAALAGLADTAPGGEIAAKLAVRTGQPATRYDEVFQDCERALAARTLPRRHFAKLLGALGELDREIFHGRATGE